MVGRAASLKALGDELERARRRKRLALLGGEPGIGKTRLAAEFATRAHERGAIALYGRSTDGPDSPYRPFVEALEHYLRHAPDVRASLEEAELRQLARILPATDAGMPAIPDAEGSGTGSEQFLLFGAIASLIGRASSAAPLVLILEDLHWADGGTLLLLRYLISSPAELPALILGTYRPTDLAVDGPLAHAIAELGREQRLSRLELNALSAADSLVLLTRLAGRGLQGPDADLAAALHRESAGNPLFLTELVRALLTSGSIREGAGGWSIDRDLRDTGLPPTLAEVIKHRVAGLGRGVGETLGAAAVVGQEFELELVESALSLSTDEIGEAWDAAERAALIRAAGTGRFAFNHPLVARALEEALSSRRRGALHREIAQAMEALGHDGDAAEVARHWAEAVPAEPLKARDWSQRAGRQALDRLDASAAVDWYLRALELHRKSGDDDDRARCELLIGLGIGHRRLGDPAFRETLLEASRLAERLGDNALLVRAALANNGGFASISGQVDEERVAILEAALHGVGESDTRERARLLATLAIELTFSGQWERRVQISDEAVDLARRLGESSTLAYVLTVRFVTIWMPATLDERLANTAEALRLADELGDPWAQFHALHWRHVGLMQSGAVAAATAAAAREQELAHRLGDPAARWIAAFDHGNLAMVAGRLDEAERLADEATGIAERSAQPGALPMFACQLSNVRYEQGRLAELQQLITEVVVEHPGIPVFRAILALAYVAGDLRNEARNLLAVDLKTEFVDLPADLTWLAAHVIYAHVTADLGDRRAAEVLYGRLRAWGGQFVYPGLSGLGSVDHALGRLATVLGRFDEADRHLASALERAERIGAPLWLARAQLSSASLLLARDAPGDRPRNVALLEEAIAGARRVGAGAVERRARSLLEHQRAMTVAAGGGGSGQRLRLRPPRVATTKGTGEGPTGNRPLEGAGPRLVQEGDYWTIRLDTFEVRLRDSKGIRYLARLLSSPGVEMHAVDLQAGHEAAGPKLPDGAAVELSVRRAGAEDAGEFLDPEAKRRYRVRIDELREQIDEAERFNDPERAASAREEVELIGRELAAAVGIGGRDRKAASQAERARVNVTRAIRNTINRIADHDETLGGHLEAAVHTGTFCSYQPSPGHEIAWKVAGAGV